MTESPSNTKLERRRDLLAVGIIAAVWVAMIAIVNPSGEFPLNDDWCYALSVKWLLQSGSYHMIAIDSIPLVTLVIWGALFCLPFGFSFTALRVSSLVAGLGGLIGIYLLARELGAGRRTGVICALVMAVSPVYFSLANAFMTDIPFIALSVFSIYAFLRALRTGSVYCYIAGTVLACLAALIRQPGVVVPLAFGVAYLFRQGTRLRTTVKAVIPVATAGIVLLAYQQWLSATGRLPDYYDLGVKNMAGLFTPGQTLRALYVVGLTACIYLGLFLFPLLLAGLISGRKSAFFIHRLAVTIGVAILIAMLIRPIGWMHGLPLSLDLGNIITPYGIGPFTLTDVAFMGLPSLSPLPGWSWLIVTGIAVLGAAMLIIHVFIAMRTLLRRSENQDVDRTFVAMMIAGGALSLIPVVMLFFRAYYDRHFLLAVPFAIGVILMSSHALPRPGRAVTALMVATLILGGTLSVGLTHDYLEWNRARWSALNDLTAAQGVPPSDIDGGYEFNGISYYNNRQSARWDGWTPVKDPFTMKYVLTFGPVPDHDVVKTYPYQNWIPPREGSVFVMTRAW